jgi:hypothetical protein
MSKPDEGTPTSRERAIKFLDLIRKKMRQNEKKLTTRRLAEAIMVKEDTIYKMFSLLSRNTLPVWMDGDLKSIHGSWLEGLIVYLKFTASEVSEVFPTLTDKDIDLIFERGKIHLIESGSVSIPIDLITEVKRIGSNTMLTEADIRSLFAFVRTAGREITFLECIKFLACLKKPLD